MAPPGKPFLIFHVSLLGLVCLELGLVTEETQQTVLSSEDRDQVLFTLRGRRCAKLRIWHRRARHWVAEEIKSLL